MQPYPKLQQPNNCVGRFLLRFLRNRCESYYLKPCMDQTKHTWFLVKLIFMLLVKSIFHVVDLYLQAKLVFLKLDQQLSPQHLGALHSKGCGRQINSLKTYLFIKINQLKTITGTERSLTVKENHIGSASKKILRYRQKTPTTLYNRI